MVILFDALSKPELVAQATISRGNKPIKTGQFTQLQD
jgi:hypothetical protein